MVTRIDHSSQFQILTQPWSSVIEAHLTAELPTFAQIDDLLWQRAVRAAVFDGGKRIRPLLTMLGWQVSGKASRETHAAALDVAAAVEFIHCSSLIFDDLPCMDNATMRRGNQALHREFGEDKAILVALGLLLKGIELVMRAGQSINAPERLGLLVTQLMNCLGPAGLICGQWFDISAKQSEAATRASAQLAALRNLKTMPLIRFSLLGGAIIAGMHQGGLETLGQFAELIGESYQLIDDLLDLLADSNYSGKDAALDLKNDRLNSAHDGNAELIMTNLQITLAQARNIISDNFSAPQASAALIAFTDYIYDHLQGAVITQ